MPDINYAEKYEAQVDERFKAASVKESASNRYGIAKELGNAIQSLTLTQFTIDKGNHEDTVLANSAGTVLKQIITDKNAYQSFIAASVELI